MGSFRLTRVWRLLGITTCIALLMVESAALGQGNPTSQTPALDALLAGGTPGQKTAVPTASPNPVSQSVATPGTLPKSGFVNLPSDIALTCDAPAAGKVEPPAPGLFDNLALFIGLDGSKGPEDLGVSADFGGRVHANWAYPIWERFGLGIQLGTGYNYSASAVKVLEPAFGINERSQLFTTGGIFQRTSFGLNWGLAYDFLFEHYYRNLDLGQYRGQAGYEFRPTDEAGVWFSIREHGDHGTVGATTFGLEPITQANLFFRHTWSNQADTRLWIGMAERHSKFNIIFQGNSPVHDAFVFGADMYIPLNNWIAIFGEANFITPNDTGTVTATLGFAIYPGGKAMNAGRNRFAPLLPVANNASFAVDVDR